MEWIYVVELGPAVHSREHGNELSGFQFVD